MNHNESQSNHNDTYIYVSKRWFDRLAKYVASPLNPPLGDFYANLKVPPDGDLEGLGFYRVPREYIEEYYRRHCCLRFRHTMEAEFPFLQSNHN
ncbi:hypothetical protein FACS189464_1900 [Bacteroidia bacterium]|nr:hypothetical protein FACS189464_1900 [Bacteroidia bacterium]